MKNKILTALFLCIGLWGVAQPTLVHDANAVERPVPASFHSIKVSGGIDIYLSQSATEALAVSASEDKYRSGIKTVVENNTLKIYYESGLGWTKNNKKLKVYIAFKQLEKIEASGASDVHVAGNIAGEKLQLELSGASDFKGSVAVNELRLELSGASDVTIAGNATNVFIQASGASDTKAYELITDFCTAKASGASDVKITVNKELNAEASGASDIFYKGSGVIKNIHTGGASSISRKD